MKTKSRSSVSHVVEWDDLIQLAEEQIQRQTRKLTQLEALRRLLLAQGPPEGAGEGGGGVRLGVLVGVGAPCQPDTLGQREGVDQKQLGERLHLFGVRLLEYHVFLVVGLVAIVSDLVRPSGR